MTISSPNELALGAPAPMLNIQLLSEDELTSIEGGVAWQGAALLLGGGAAMCVLGVAIGVALYCILN